MRKYMVNLRSSCYSIFNFFNLRKKREKLIKKTTRLSVGHDSTTEKENLYVNGFLFSRGFHWTWLFHLNMARKTNWVRFWILRFNLFPFFGVILGCFRIVEWFIYRLLWCFWMKLCWNNFLRKPINNGRILWNKWLVASFTPKKKITKK